MAKWAFVMQIHLLRHAMAEAGGAGMPDADRELTPEGKQTARAVTRMAAAAGVSPDLVLTSPHKRAIATARIACEQLGYAGEPLTTNVLLPNTSPGTAWDEIRIHKNHQSVLLVGHQPLCGALGDYLLNAAEVLIDFKTGAWLCLEITQFGAQPRGVLKWFVTANLAKAYV